ncbi:MAG: response regulator [Deltaproteobacteria bacterium]|nr:response regulator [Deltaproteobacteria bacterium]
MGKSGRVLVLDDEKIVCDRLTEHFSKKGLEVEAFTDSQQAIDRIASQDFDVIITDLKMKGPTGMDVVHFVRRNRPGAELIVITGYASIDTAREAEYSGVYKFITKPFKMNNLAKSVMKAVHKAQTRKGR